MRQVTVTADATGNSSPVVLDQYITPFNVTVNFSGTGSLEVSTTDPFPKVNGDFVAPTFTWIADTTLADTIGNLYTPVRAVRLTGATPGDTLTVIQAGI